MLDDNISLYYLLYFLYENIPLNMAHAALTLIHVLVHYVIFYMYCTVSFQHLSLHNIRDKIRRGRFNKVTGKKYNNLYCTVQKKKKLSDDCIIYYSW
jgi:hypothetical protein